MTEDFKTEYDRLENFLAADPDYARLDAECDRLQAIVEKQGQIAHNASIDFQAWSLCQETLEYAVFDVPDFRPDNLALFNGELAACYLDSGAKQFERLKRECMIKGGEASKAWKEATDQLAEVKHERQLRRSALVDVWHKKQNDEKAANQEAE